MMDVMVKNRAKWYWIKRFTLWGFLLRTEITLWDRMSSVLKFFFGSIRLFLIWGIRLNTDFEQIKKEICCWHQFTYLHTYVRVCVGVLYVIIWYQLYCRDTLGIGGLSIDRRPPSKNLWSRRVWTVSHSNIGLGFVETAYASIVEEAGFGIFEI